MIHARYPDLGKQLVLFERPLVWIVVDGPDHVDWLQGMVSNDVGRLEPGQGCRAAHLTPQGKVVALMTVLRDVQSMGILTDARPDPPVAAQMERLLIMEDASIADRSGDVRTFSLIGQGASGFVSELFHREVAFAAKWDHSSASGARAIRASLGFDFVVDVDRLEEFADRVDGAGVARGDPELWDVLRLEAGIPEWGSDVDARVTLPELGEDAIDYRKGCYIGQEVVAKIKYLGHVNRRLMGLRLEGERVPEPGAIERGGREVGRLTSAAYSPGLGCVIALAYVSRGSDQPGGEVEVVRDGSPIRASLVELPFVEWEAHY